MPTTKDYQHFIQGELNTLTTKQFRAPADSRIAFAYQYGFILGFLIKLMKERPELISEFKSHIKSTLKRLDK